MQCLGPDSDGAPSALLHLGIVGGSGAKSSLGKDLLGPK